MRKFRTRATALAASLLIIGGLGVVRMDSASAAGPTCPTNKLCLFDFYSPTSNKVTYSPSTECITIGTGSTGATMNNKTSYIINNTGYRWKVFNASHCRGTTTAPIYADSSGPMAGIWQNSISSLKRL